MIKKYLQYIARCKGMTIHTLSDEKSKKMLSET